MATILDGNAVAKKLREKITKRIVTLTAPSHGSCIRRDRQEPPCLAVVLCSNDPASQVYVAKKREACAEVGITSLLIEPFQGGIEKYAHKIDHLLDTIEWLNNDKSIHGILVQLPLPDGLDPTQVFDKINPLKDVDVFNPLNVGLLLQGRPRFIPCTPHAVQELLWYSGIELEGKSVAIVNRSDVVGKPLSALLMQDDGTKANATVTVCHDKTPPTRLRHVCREADIVVVAVGKPNFLTADMVESHSIVVDVGINRIPGGKRICGDCDSAVYEKVATYSPVPGGVGPLTVTMLLHNTVKAFTMR